VACFDHHCPWIGKCVGERNRFPYFWFLIFQLAEFFVTLVLTIRVSLPFFADDQRLTSGGLAPLEKALLLGGLAAVLYETAMLGYLALLQTYLMSVNLSTCTRLAFYFAGEYLRWSKISYLSTFPQHSALPFSRGVRNNLRYFCRWRSGHSHFEKWRFAQVQH